jgi:predicted DNA-binding ribbon-helix-helix protein
LTSTVIKRSIVIDRHKTSISIEDVFWNSLKEIARERGSTLSELVASIDSGRGAGSNLSSAIRVFILEHYRARLESVENNQPASNAPAAVGSPPHKDDFRR